MPGSTGMTHLFSFRQEGKCKSNPRLKAVPADELVRNLHMTPAHSIGEAIELANQMLDQKDATVTVIPDERVFTICSYFAAAAMI